MTKLSASGPRLTDDAFLGGGLRILQPEAGYRAGIDAVLLAAAAPVGASRKELVLDVGAGVGVVGLAVAHRAANAHATLIEREPLLADLARQNIFRNNLGTRAEVIEADVTRSPEDLPDLSDLAETFDHVLANPPFNPEGAGTVSVDMLKTASNVMPGGNLSRWARFMVAMARPGGTATMIHRADAVGEVLSAMSGRFGGLLVLPLHPREGKSAIRVLVQGVKGSSAPTELRPGLFLHAAGSRFRPEVETILRHGAALQVREPRRKRAAKA